MRTKTDIADQLFSKWIRLRDMRCVRCESRVRLNGDGLPVSHSASHFWGRGKENTRFDPENVDTLCFPCHRMWGGDFRSEYKSFKIRQLGEKGFEKMQLRSNAYKKKDRKAEKLIWREKLKEMGLKA